MRTVVDEERTGMAKAVKWLVGDRDEEGMMGLSVWDAR